MTKDEMLKDMYGLAIFLSNKLKEQGIPEREMHSITFDSSGYIYCTIKHGNILDTFSRLSDKHEAIRSSYHDERK